MPQAGVNGVELHYEVTSEGPPVVFVHEFAADYRSWDPQVKFFSRLYQCVTYNHRGFPPSSVPEAPEAYSLDSLVGDLRVLLAHLGIRRAHIVGHGLGANVSLGLALRSPELFRSVVLTSCGAGSVSIEQFQQEMKAMIDVLLTRGMRALADEYSQSPSRQSLKRKDPKGWAEFRERLAEHSAPGSAYTLQGVALRRPTVVSLKQELNRLPVPALIVVGDGDEPAIEPAVFMKREIPSSGLVVLPQTRHTPNLEEPALFNQVVLDFFRLVEAGRWETR